MHVGVITYQTGHLKTAEITRKLMSKSFRVTLFAFPFKPRRQNPEARYADRPTQLVDYDVPAFCRRYGIGYVPVPGWGEDFAAALGVPGAAETPDVFLHCIAKIIPPAFIRGRTILNGHPGLLPHNRGVDSFKWAIVNKWPIGVTLHVIDEAIDRGWILRRMRVPLLENDRLDDVWRRAYDVETDLLANFDYYLHNRARDWFVGDTHPCSHRLIPREIDAEIEQVFMQNRAELIAASTNLNIHEHPADTAPAAGPDATV